MSWILFIVLIAVACPMIMRGMGSGRYNRLSPTDRERFDALEHELDDRLDQIERLDARVSEAESRLDFAERLLARGSEDELTGAESR